MPIVRPAENSDFKFYWEHLRRHGMESGRQGDIIFSPNEEPLDTAFGEFEKGCRESWVKSPSEVGWVRSWFVADSNGIYGDLNLVQRPHLKSCLHRATLMMGIERSHRNQGFGSSLMEEAINWSRSQTTLEWIQLFVFENNEPAKKLYLKYGFRENGSTPDMFRVFGNQIADTSMILKLK